MLNQGDLKKIKEIVEEFFKKMTFEVEIEILPQKDLTLPINLKLKEPQILIGEGGQTLFETQHLLKAILKRKISEPFFVDLDISGYKKKKIEYLKELAKALLMKWPLLKKKKAWLQCQLMKEELFTWN